MVINMKKAWLILCAAVVLFAFAACGSANEQNGSEARRTDAAFNTDADGTSSVVPEPSLPQSEPEGQTTPGTPSEPITQPERPDTKEESEMNQIEIAVGNRTFSATFYDNAAAKALAEQLPLTLDMSELNGNEKYYYLENSLPTNAGRPSGINEGDLMLYGNNCLVLFYKSFSTSYSYTPLGRIDDPAGLAEALGNGSVQVTFRKS